MFAMKFVHISVAIAILFLAGCAVFSDDSAGVEVSRLIELDDGFAFKKRVKKNTLLGVDMPQPSQSGHRIIGAAFDPDLLALVNFQEYQENGERRVRYVFEAMSDGSTDVLFKMEPVAGGSTEMYKQLTVTIGKNDTLF